MSHDPKALLGAIIVVESSKLKELCNDIQHEYVEDTIVLHRVCSILDGDADPLDRVKDAAPLLKAVDVAFMNRATGSSAAKMRMNKLSIAIRNVRRRMTKAADELMTTTQRLSTGEYPVQEPDDDAN